MENAYYQNTPKRRGKKKIIVIFVMFIIILAAAIFFFKPQFLSTVFNKSEVVVSITPAPTEIFFPTEILTPTPSAIPTLSATSVPARLPTPTKRIIDPVDRASGLNRSDLSVEVKNGGGVVGAGSRASEVLKGFGYRVITIGNADNFDYEDTVITVKPEKSKYLPILKKDLSITYSIGSTSADLSASSSADAVVIVGKQ